MSVSSDLKYINKDRWLSEMLQTKLVQNGCEIASKPCFIAALIFTHFLPCKSDPID